MYSRQIRPSSLSTASRIRKISIAENFRLYLIAISSDPDFRGGNAFSFANFDDKFQHAGERTYAYEFFIFPPGISSLLYARLRLPRGELSVLR